MKRWKIWLSIVVALVISAYPAKMILDHFGRRIQADWAWVQSKRCSALGTLLYRYNEKHGHYPESLHDLVDSKIIDESAFRNLKFQRNSSAEPQDWRYSKPENISQFALFSGDPVTNWNAPRSIYIAGHADGSTTGFGEEKLPGMTRNHLRPNHLADQHETVRNPHLPRRIIR